MENEDASCKTFFYLIKGIASAFEFYTSPEQKTIQIIYVSSLN